MAAWADNAAHAPVRTPRPRPRPKAVPRGKARRRPALLGGVVWIGALAVLLAGIVALNVAVLQANVRLDDLARTSTDLQARNAQLSSQLSSEGATPQVESLARARLGLDLAAPEQQLYVELKRPR
jgi:cell division protein FtsL